MEALYLLTDGKPDTSRRLILREVQRLKEKNDVKVHAISLSCSDRWGGRVTSLPDGHVSEADPQPIQGLMLDAEPSWA